MTRHGAAGYTLIELIVAIAIMLIVTAGVFALIDPSQESFASEPEITDMQQRMRIAAGTLYGNIVMAGAGAYAGSHLGPLVRFFAPVLPYRQGAVAADPAGTYKADTITLLYVPSTMSQTTIATSMPGSSPALTVFNEPQCGDDDLCGLAKGMTILVYDDTGQYNSYEVTAAAGSVGQLQIHESGSPSYVPSIGAKVVQAKTATYYLRADTVQQAYQLMFYDGSTNPDVPVVDNVVGLTFEYYGDPQPPTMRKPLEAAAGPWTTYGPAPRIANPPYAAGENCVFVADGSPVPVPRLAALGATNAPLVKLTAAQLTDGPWCPNEGSSVRWDADLLRIRKVAVTVRVQSALASLRGPAGALFVHAGTSMGGRRWVPDREFRFDVSPRNLNLDR